MSVEHMEGHPRALVEFHDGKTLVVYAFHEYNRNVKFFLNFGITEDPNVDYAIVQNMPNWSLNKKSELKQSEIGDSKLYWIRRPNISQDLGAYGEVVRTIPEDTYDYMLFINSSMRGPFLPTWYNKKEHWASCFTRLLSDTVAIVGTSINTLHLTENDAHVQSMAYALDTRGVEIYRHHGIFAQENKVVPKDDLIETVEVGGSQLLLKYGYNLDCLLTAVHGRDWHDTKSAIVSNRYRLEDVWNDRAYFGYNVHPHETLFFKTNRPYNPKYTIHDEMTSWLEKTMDDSPPDIVHHFLEDTEYKNTIDDFEEEIHHDHEGLSNTAWFIITGVLFTFMVLFAVFWALRVGSK
jgi:hypothetical protein